MINKWQLYSVYLSANSVAIAEPLYILSTSSNPFVRLVIAKELSRAAENELFKFSAIIDAEELHKQAAEAFVALETALGEHDWFFGAERPGLFDASVFSYTHLLMSDDLGLGWANTHLRDALLSRKNLVNHRNRISASFYSGHA